MLISNKFEYIFNIKTLLSFSKIRLLYYIISVHSYNLTLSVSNDEYDTRSIVITNSLLSFLIWRFKWKKILAKGSSYLDMKMLLL